MSGTIGSSRQHYSEFQEILSALKSINTKKIKSITKTFRLDEDMLTKIAQQAETNNTHSPLCETYGMSMSMSRHKQTNNESVDSKSKFG